MGFLDNEGLQKTLTHINNNMNFLINGVISKADDASTTVAQALASTSSDFPVLLKNTANSTNETAGVKYDPDLKYNPSTNTFTIPSVKTNKIEDNGGTLNIINNNTTNNSNDFIVIESTNGQIDLRTKTVVNVYTNGSIGTISANLSGNATSADKLTTARTIDGVSFDGSANITHYGVCSTAASAQTKVVSCTGFVLGTGARIFVKFNNTNTNTSTSLALNVNSTGAKPIRYRGGFQTNLPGKFVANSVWEFLYDGTNYEVIGEMDSDTKVLQTSASTSSDFPVLLKNTANSTNETAGVKYNSNIKINPSKKYLSGITTISPVADATSYNDIIYSEGNNALYLMGSVIETGLKTFEGSNGSADYVCVAEIQITGSTPGYCNSAISFQIAVRDEAWHNNVYVKFAYPGSSTATATSGTVYCELPWDLHQSTVSGETKPNIFLVKPVNSPGNDRWHLVVKQNSTYDNIDLIRVSIPSYLKNVIKVIVGNHYWTPSDWTSLNATKIQANYIGY